MLSHDNSYLVFWDGSYLSSSNDNDIVSQKSNITFVSGEKLQEQQWKKEKAAVSMAVEARVIWFIRGLGKEAFLLHWTSKFWNFQKHVQGLPTTIYDTS